MSKVVLGTAIIFFLFLGWFISRNNPDRDKVCVNDSCFEIEVAKTAGERARGLMGRESLAQGAGMLFVFEEEGIYPFWMKNTLISLDIIWIGEDKKVIRIEKNLPPCKTEECESYQPLTEAKYVLEINGGLADRFNMQIGDSVVLPDEY